MIPFSKIKNISLQKFFSVFLEDASSRSQMFMEYAASLIIGIGAISIKDECKKRNLEKSLKIRRPLTQERTLGSQSADQKLGAQRRRYGCLSQP